MDFIRNFLQFPSVSVSKPIKIPKFKKLRQWSHDSLANLTQLTNRAVATASHINERNQKSPETHPTTSGISTISAAIREQQFDPKKDNFGLYALKCDRSRSLANARRGILLNLPSSSSSGAKLKGSGSFQTIDRNHEIFKSCEALDDDENGKDNPRKLNQRATKIAPPPRKKKKNDAHLRLNKAGCGTTTAFEQLERNDSGLYRIVNATEMAKITFVEPKTMKEMKNATIVAPKPKVEKAVAVKATSYEVKRPIIAKVKDYEWHQQQRRPSRGSLTKKIEPKPNLIKKSFSFDPIADVDIFKSNRLIDQKKLFDEFDELFEKNNQKMEAAPKSPTLAFRKLNELKKFPSSSFSISTDDDECDKKEIKLITPPVPASFILNATQSVEDSVVARKPKIISEQKKNVQQRKILYYNDENELQELIKRRMLGDDDVRKPENSTLPLVSNDRHAPSQQVIAAHSSSSKSNSLRIFSNEGIFVFNL